MTGNTQNVDDPKTQDADADPVAPETPLPNGENDPSQQAPATEADLRAELNDLQARYRGLQSAVDKQRAQSDQVKTTLERLGVTLTPEQETEYRMMKLEEQVGQLNTSSAGPTVSQPTPQTPPDIVEVFRKAEMDPNTPEAVRLATENPDPVDLALALGKRQQSQLNTKPSPAAAAQPAGGSSTTVKPINEDALVAEFNELRQKPMSHILASGKSVLQRRNEISALLGGNTQ